MTEVTVRTPAGDMPAYVATPAGTGPWPAVVVHDFAGMGQDLRNQADWLASAGFLAASVNYGGCQKDAERALEGACPIVGSYGGRDSSPLGRRAAVRLEEALTTLGVEHDIKIYPDAGHGFMNDFARAYQMLLLVLLSKASGTRYEDEATRDARRRIVSFFDAQLGRPA